MALGREETWRRAAGPWELGGKVWLLPMGLGMAARGSVSRRAQGSSGLWELRRETSTETGLGPRQGSFGKACLLLGTQLGDLPRKEFLWISLSSSRSTDAPDFYSCSSGNGGFKTILFFLLSLFVWFVGAGRGEGHCSRREWAMCLHWVPRCAVNISKPCHLASPLLCARL